MKTTIAVGCVMLVVACLQSRVKMTHRTACLCQNDLRSVKCHSGQGLVLSGSWSVVSLSVVSGS
jgi:hypothetical protein